MLHRRAIRNAEEGEEKKRPSWMEERRDLTVALHDSIYLKMTLLVQCVMVWRKFLQQLSLFERALSVHMGATGLQSFCAIGVTCEAPKSLSSSVAG